MYEIDAIVFFILGLLVTGYFAATLSDINHGVGEISKVKLIITLILATIMGITMSNMDYESGIIVMIIWLVLLYGLGIATNAMCKYIGNYVTCKILGPIIMIVYLGGAVAVVFAEIIFEVGGRL